jgi:hypothetical protein
MNDWKFEIKQIINSIGMGKIFICGCGRKKFFFCDHFNWKMWGMKIIKIQKIMFNQSNLNGKLFGWEGAKRDQKKGAKIFTLLLVHRARVIFHN